MSYHSKSCTSLMKHLGGCWLCARSFGNCAEFPGGHMQQRRSTKEETYAFFGRLTFHRGHLLSLNSQQHQSS